MVKKESELAVITKAKDLGNYIFVVTDKSPKKFRFTIVSRMQNYALDIIEQLFRANSEYITSSEERTKIERRKRYQKDAYISLKLLGYVALMAREQQCILPKQYEQISMKLAEISRLLISWSRSDHNRYRG